MHQRRSTIRVDLVLISRLTGHGSGCDDKRREKNARRSPTHNTYKLVDNVSDKTMQKKERITRPRDWFFMRDGKLFFGTLVFHWEQIPAAPHRRWTPRDADFSACAHDVYTLSEATHHSRPQIRNRSRNLMALRQKWRYNFHRSSIHVKFLRHFFKWVYT